MNTEPTKEQEKEFWERYGIRLVQDIPFVEAKEAYCYPEGTYMAYYPPIDLNNLFKWTIPKAIAKLIMTGIGIRSSWDKLLSIWMNFYFEGMEIEDALFWTLWEIIKEVENNG